MPLNLPVVSLGETHVRPTAMLWRNMAAMATEEMLRANPIDGVVLLGGCDKTIPSLLMAAASVDLPAVVVPGGPMLTGTFRGVPLGCGTDVWRLSRGGPRRHAVGRAVPAVGVVDDPQPRALQHHGHRLDDGPARRGARHDRPRTRRHPGRRTAGCWRLPTHTGGLAVELVAAGPPAQHGPDRGSFHNAIVALAAIGGSTNAVVHLLAIAGRLGIDLTLDDFDRIGAHVPLLVDLQPAGRFLMEDFHRAGGLLAVLREVRDLLDPTALTVTGRPLVDYLDDAPIWDPEVIRVRAEPLLPDAGIAVLRGNLAPGRRDHQAGRRVAATCSRTAAGRSCSTRVEDLHARHRRPRPRRRRRLGAGAARLRAAGLPGHAGGREPAAAEEAAANRASATWCGSATAG